VVSALKKKTREEREGGEGRMLSNTKFGLLLYYTHPL